VKTNTFETISSVDLCSITGGQDVAAKTAKCQDDKQWLENPISRVVPGRALVGIDYALRGCRAVTGPISTTF
jgi:hypothetical protein